MIREPVQLIQLIKRNHLGHEHWSFQPDSSEFETEFRLVLRSGQER